MPLKSPDDFFKKPTPQPEPVVEEVVLPTPVEKVVEEKKPQQPVKVAVNVEPITEGVVQSILNLSSELSKKADIGNVIRIQESIELYVDDLTAKIDALDIRYYEKEIDGIYENLGALADAIDENLATLSKLSGRSVEELRDEFSVMFKELQESLTAATENAFEERKELLELHQKLQEAVADIPNQESRFDPAPILENIETVRESLLININESNTSIREKVDSLDIRYYEEDLETIQKFAEEVKESIKYYDGDITSLEKSIASTEKKLTEAINRKTKTLQKTIKESAESVRADFPVVPEVKYYDEEVELINEQLGNIRKSITELPEVKYYDKEVEKLAEAVKDVDAKLSLIEIPDWSGAIAEIREEISATQKLNEEFLSEVEDPIAPQNMEDFVTIEQFQKHYRTFLERVQIQLGSLGGGGAVRILDMDDVDLDLRMNPQNYNGQVLAIQHDSVTGITTFVPTTGGGGSGSGSQGATGPTGATGPQGATGLAGPQGATGADSIVPGPDGATGPKGDDGEQGATGETGVQGATGETGEQGATGPAGGGVFVVTAERNTTLATGNEFAFGNGGNNDVTGAVIAQDCVLRTISLSNSTNYTGALTVIAVINDVEQPTLFVQGTVGQNQATSAVLDFDISAGDKITFRCTATGGGGSCVLTALFATSGAIGPEGPQGATGPSGGPQGATGLEGPQGATGNTGPQGASGLQGIQGASGLQGIQGATGLIGPQGATGPTGPVGTVILGTVPNEASLPGTGTVGEGYVVTAPNTEPANSVFVWDGSQYNSIGPVQGPQGQQGPPGATGPAGPVFSADYIKCSLNQLSDINSTTLSTFTARAAINTTPQFQSGGFTVAAAGITVPTAGIYQVTSNCYMTSTIQRASVATQFAVNGTLAGEIAAMGYIRATGGHNESTVNLTTLLSLAADDVVDIHFAREAVAGTVNLESANSAITLMRIA